MNHGQNALDFIESNLNAGRTVMLSTYLKATKVTPSNYKKWAANGWKMFNVTEKGSLVMASGKYWVEVVSANGISSIKITAH